MPTPEELKGLSDQAVVEAINAVRFKIGDLRREEIELENELGRREHGLAVGEDVEIQGARYRCAGFGYSGPKLVRLARNGQVAPNKGMKYAFNWPEWKNGERDSPF